MHEISLVQGLFEQLQGLATANKATKIISVTMEIGPLSGIVVDSFQFGFDVYAADDKLVRGAQLIIKIPQVSYTCTQCKRLVVTDDRKPDACVYCGELLLIVKGGDDLILRQVEME